MLGPLSATGFVLLVLPMRGPTWPTHLGGKRDEAMVGNVPCLVAADEGKRRPTRTRRWWWIAGLSLIVLTASGVGLAYVERISPQFPVVHGAPYQIEVGDGGCPVVPEQVPFVDSPGQFVAPDPTEVVLCTWVDYDGDGVAEAPGTAVHGGQVPPLQRTLRGQPAAEFARLLDQMPDRNGAWRDWQRRHSGFWPDAPWDNGPWDAEASCMSPAMLPVQTYAYVLHYRERDAVPIIASCHGWTDGTRTRIPITYTRPHLTDQFIALYESQP